jgi:hypothetical protein
VAASEATPYAEYTQAAYPRRASFLSPRSQPLPAPIPPDLFELRLWRRSGELDLVLPLSLSLSISRGGSGLGWSGTDSSANS